MFGSYRPPFEIEIEGVRISCKREGSGFVYKRVGPEEEKDLLIFSKDIELLLNPVEPVNLPKDITHFLYIELQKKVILGPSEKTGFYIKFPVEISIFVNKTKGKWDSIDLFTLALQKFTLYGEVTTGRICKYYSSGVYNDIPETNPLREGVMEVEIKNRTNEWVELGILVFDAYHMKIYYDSSMVGMRAVVEIESETVAETSFKDSPLRRPMNKSMELYVTKKIPVLTDRFVMEWGY